MRHPENSGNSIRKNPGNLHCSIPAAFPRLSRPPIFPKTLILVNMYPNVTETEKEKYKMQAKRLTVSGNMGNSKPETVDRGVFPPQNQNSGSEAVRRSQVGFSYAQNNKLNLNMEHMKLTRDNARSYVLCSFILFKLIKFSLLRRNPNQ
jgi:hypothetical protein